VPIAANRRKKLRNLLAGEGNWLGFTKIGSALVEVEKNYRPQHMRLLRLINATFISPDCAFYNSIELRRGF
jgi:hypothetical protein